MTWAKKLEPSKKRGDRFWTLLAKIEGDFKERDKICREIYETCASIDKECAFRLGIVPNERLQVTVNQLQERFGREHRLRHVWNDMEINSE